MMQVRAEDPIQGLSGEQCCVWIYSSKLSRLLTQVEEKPDVTYSDVGGCKEQIEKLREVVETPLLHVSISAFHTT